MGLNMLGCDFVVVGLVLAVVVVKSGAFHHNLPSVI